MELLTGDDFLSHRHFLPYIVAIITDTGLRLFEAVGLMIDDINLETPPTLSLHQATSSQTS